MVFQKWVDNMKKWLVQYSKEFVHNVIVHPLMMFMPVKWGNWMHDTNAEWAFGKNIK